MATLYIFSQAIRHVCGIMSQDVLTNLRRIYVL